MNRLYVRNIPWLTTEEELRKFFTGRGYTVADVKIIVSPENGRSKGYGFVTFGSEKEAEAAMCDVQGEPLRGRPLYVAPATARRLQRGNSFAPGTSERSGRGRDGNPHRVKSRREDPENFGWGNRDD